MNELRKEEKKAGRGYKAAVLAFLMSVSLCGCSSAAAVDEAVNAGEEETAETSASENPVENTIAEIAQGNIRHAVEIANMARLTAKTDQSLDEDTVAMLDNLYAYCQMHLYLDNEDIDAAKPWVEKINPDLLPEQVKTLFDDLYAQYRDQLSK